jgi:hypothetical protein
MWTHAFLDTIGVRDGVVADFMYEDPFMSLLGSREGSMVVPTGFELPPPTCGNSPMG